MGVKQFLKLSLKEIRRKRVIVGLLLILIVPSFLFCILLSQIFLFRLSEEYSSRIAWPGEIMVSNITEQDVAPIEEVDGVRYVVFPGWIDLFGLEYFNRSYVVTILWYNVEDPTTLHPKFLIKGELPKSNNECSVVLDSIAAALFEEIGFGCDIGEKIIILGKEFEVKGIVGSPFVRGGEKKTLITGGNVVFIFVPLGVFKELAFIARNDLEYSQVAEPVDLAYVRVEDFSSVDEVANNIRKVVPRGAHVSTMVEEKKEYIRWVYVTNLPVILTCYIMAGVLMLWEVKHAKKQILTLKSLGWERERILKLLVTRNSILGFLSSVIGWVFIVNFIIFSLRYVNLYLLMNLFLAFPMVFVFSVSATLIFSIPSIIRVYKLNVEEALKV